MVTDIADAAVAAEDWVSTGEAAIDIVVAVVVTTRGMDVGIDFVVGLGRDSGPVLFVVMVVAAVAVERLGIVVRADTIRVAAVVDNRLVAVVVSAAVVAV